MRDAARALIEGFAAHGGRIDLARAAFPLVPDWTDLSTGLAPWHYPASVDIADLERLPSPEGLAQLEATAARVFGAEPRHVVAVPGSDLGLRLLGQVIGGHAAVVRPGYSGHLAMWTDAAPEAIGSGEILAAAQRCRAVVLARPNNPDGVVVDAGELEAAAATLAARGGWLIVDEAFVDATPGDSLSGKGWPGLVMLRSFGKFFGMAGLRLGFVIAPDALVGTLRQRLGDWPLSAPAIRIGSAAYADLAWQDAQRRRLTVAAQRLDALLAGAGLAVVGATAFFRLIQTPARDRLFVHLCDSGILTRPFIDAPDRLRIGLPRDEPEWNKLTLALDRLTLDRPTLDQWSTA